MTLTKTQLRRQYGMCVHTGFRKTVYGNDDKILEWLIKSGARYARDLLVPKDFFGQQSLYAKYAEAGIKLHCTVGVYGHTDAEDRANYVKRLRANAGYLDSVAGWNEPDGDGVPISEWLKPTVEHQRWLYDTISTDPLLDHIKVLPGAIRDKNPNLRSELARLYEAIDGFYDLANLHLYPGKGDVAKYCNGRFGMLPRGRGFWVTEGGASTARQSYTRQAEVCVQMLEWAAGRGARCYIYEQMDDPDGGTGLQQNFGIYESNWRDKPAVVALRRAVL